MPAAQKTVESIPLPAPNPFSSSDAAAWPESNVQDAQNISKDANTHLQVTVLIDQDVARLQIPMNHASRVNILQTSQDLVQKVLDELFFERSGSKETVQVGSEEFGDEVAILVSSSVRSRIEKAGRQRRSGSELRFGFVNSHVFQRGNENVAERDDL